MATIGSTVTTLADWATRADADGKIASIAEILAQSNQILTDAVFKESNLPTGEKVTIRTGLPTIYWRSLNVGVPPSKSTTVQVDESCGILEAYSEIDKDLAMLNGNTAEFRLSEDTAFLEGMNQAQAQCLIYGNPGTDPRQFLGLAPRYSSSSASNGQNIIKFGGSGSTNTSIWLVVWGPNTVYCTYPKGSKFGLNHDDLGEDTVIDSNGGRFQALRSHYQWKNGLVVKDWRYAVRIANIETGSGSGGLQNATPNDLIAPMARSMDRIPNLQAGNAAFYVNRTVMSWLKVQALNKSNNALSIQDALSQFGKPAGKELQFLGVPVRLCDQILNTEATVS